MNKMILYVLSIFSIVISVLCRAEQLTLPVTTCKRNSTDYLTCLKEALQESWPRFQTGLPEFDFPRLDPFDFKGDKIVVNRNEIHVEGRIINATVYGSQNIRFLDVRPHFLDDAFHLELDVQLPKIFIPSYVNGKANILGIQTYGAGQVNITIIEGRAIWDITGNIKNDTWIIENFHMDMTVESLKFHLSDFFDGIKELNDVLQEFMNEYWPPIYRTIAPIIFETISDPLCKDLSNRIFSKISFSKVFP